MLLNVFSSQPRTIDNNIPGVGNLSTEEKDRDDVMERLLEWRRQKFLTFDDLNRELPDNVVSPDDIEDVLQKLEAQTFGR